MSDAPPGSTVLSLEEKRRLLAQKLQKKAERKAGIHEAFAAQAARTPDAPALVFEGRTLSYAELDAAANRLAQHLGRCGAAPETIVGVVAERTPETAVALLAVLKAGAAYLPLDPSYPADRLRYMLADSGARLIVSHGAMPAGLDDGGRDDGGLGDDGLDDGGLDDGGRADAILPRVVDPVLDAERIAACPAVAPPVSVDAESLAYVIYTSGSTGRPKGVAVPHRGVPNLASWKATRLGQRAEDRALQFASLSFDAAVEELFGAWLAGGTLVMAPRESLLPGDPLRETLRRERITFATLPPSVLAMMDPADFPDLRVVVSAGEALPAAVAARWAGAVELHNAYGPTETTVSASSGRVAAEGGAPDIGRPLDNVRAAVLDGMGRPLPPGVPGELYVGGAGVARGYLGRPGMTAERFVPDPFGERPGARWYRTGDRVRMKPDGTLQYLGRLDEQVKVRGFRIEPGEVERVLLAHPGLRAARVIVREDEPGDKRLVAYVAGDADADALRAHLRGTLPEYMVPGAFVVLDALPLTPNGKLDVRALPAPEGRPAAARYVEPRTPLEAAVAEIWGEVLHVERVGAADRFFDLGGHSLLAGRIISRVREALGVELPLRTLFRGLTVAEFAATVDALRRTEGPVTPPVVPVERGGPLPLSFAQERLWFLHQMQPGSASYNISSALRLGGALDAAALERALGEVVRRHEALRTTFAESGGAPVQAIAPFAGFQLAIEDFSELDAADADATVQRRAAEEAARPFDLAAGPLFRAVLLRIDEVDHVLLVSMHHAVSDGWSMNVLVRELSALYAAYRDGGESPLADLPVQYADYAVWQRAQLGGDALDRQLAYWRERLAGAPELLELPTDHPRPAVQGHRGASVPIAFSGELLDALQALGQREGATLYMVLLGAFQLLLAKYAGTEDVVVGSPVAGRTRGETEGLIGFFANTLVLRTDLGGDPDFREVMRRVRDVTLGAYEHQEMPFEKLVAELQPERSLAHSPLFQVTFTLENADESPVEMTGLDVRPAGAALDSAKFDLSLGLVATADDLRGGLAYSTDLFERATIERMRGHFRRVLEQVAADADVRLSGIGLLDDAERRQVLEAWNGPGDDIAPAPFVHQAFEAWAERTPDAVAVSFDGRSLTYAALNAWANRIAHALIRRGAGPEVRVGLCVERGMEMVAAILAVLKAGGAYVPLDPAYPAERLAWMLADAGVPILLTQESLRAVLPARDGVEVITLDGAADSLAAERGENPGVAVAADTLAYVIYTSGSTGTPKGVGVEHGNLARLFAATEPWFGFGADDVWTLFHSYAFDFSVWETWGALRYGGRLVVVPHHTTRDPESFHALVQAEGVTVLNQTPSAFRQFIRADAQRGGPLALRTVIFGGEALEPASLREWVDARGDDQPRLVNMYGITETTVHVTYRPLSREDVFAGGGSPIGVRIPDLQLYVLDAARRPLPVGVPGELYVGGAGVARGYLHRPELTAERFIQNPFGAGRLYRTADRVRWLADGTLDYRGRLDAQVKIRGFRIELGEIESALLGHADVGEAAAVVREDVPGDARIVAYVVGDADAESLRAHLSARLPEYMVPAAFVAVDALPLTPNGKLDRKALPAPDFASAEDAYVAPRTPVEAVLAGIWADVLRVERVGVHDGFFALGGHSLLATQVVSRIRETLAVELPLRALFEGPTVGALAAAVEEMRRADGPASAPVVPVDRSQPLPLSFAQERLWVLDRLEPGRAVYNVPLAVRLHGALDAAALRRALGEVVRRHEALRTVFADADGVPVQVIQPFAGFDLPVEDLSGVDADARRAQVERRVAEFAARPFDLAAGPLFRAVLLRGAEDDHVLVLCMHHVVSDGWSMGILFRELVALYASDRDGVESPLPPLPVQYADYAVWQRAQLQGEALGRELAWWKARLAGAPALLELPTDRPRPAVQSYAGAQVPAAFSPALLARLHALAQREGATLYMVLLAAFQVLLARYAGSDDVVVGSPIAGRTRRETEGLIGFFVNTLVMRTELGGAADFRAVLRRVREVTLGAYEHQQVPFEKLVAELQPERSRSHAALFQVMFSLQNEARAGGALPGLRMEGMATPLETVRFDLSLTLSEDDRGLRGAMAYSTALFDRTTIERMLGHLERVLEHAADRPDAPLARLELLAGAERAQVLEAWNATDAPYPAGRCIHQLVEDQAARTPDAVALVHAGERLTYRELDARANRLAHRLLELGVRPEEPVALFAPAGIAGITGLLGICKSGGAYLPLDGAAPGERSASLADESGARVVVAATEAEARAWAGDRPIVAMDRFDALDGYPSIAPAVPVTAGHLAYVLYTSGSTGRPKGVLVEHGSVCNLAAAFARTYGLGEGDRMLLLAPLHFDSSVAETFATLCSGAALHVPHGDALLPGDEQVDLFRRARITHAKFTPTALAALPYAALPDLQVIAAGGEAVTAELVDRWRPGRRFLQTYGPTEATVRAACHWCGDEPGPPPLGPPVANGRLYVVDAALNPLPAGLPGELVIGGVPVARGYLGRPAATAERFIPDPFAKTPGARLYRTGDRARWRPSGVVEFLGRFDDQVKIRGLRIEPGEIQAALRQAPGVTECAVLAREDAPGDKRLVAYVVGDVDAEALRAHLRRTLPEYMVPGAFVALERLPRSTSDKLDRAALPAPERAPDEARYVAPRTPAEESLARIWAELLRRERVGVHDNFFALGGDSILAIQVVSRARRAGVELSPRQVFEHQTVAGLAALAVEGDGARARRAEQGRVEGAVPLTPIQARFLEQARTAPWHFNQSVRMEVDAAVGPAVLQAALPAVLEHHDALRLRFRRTDAGWEQWHAASAGITLERIDLSGVAEDDLPRLQAEAADRAQASLDLERGPLGRALLFDGGERGRVLLLVLHHLVVDGVSWRILRDDLERACAQVQAGEPVDLGAKTTSYRQWAQALEAYASDPALRDEAAYWLAQGAADVAALPRDGDGDGADASAGAAGPVVVRLDVDETRALLQDVPAAYRTQVNDVLLCALADAIGGWVGGSRIRLALEGHGREEEVGEGIDLTRTVGWFTSVYPLVLDTAGAAGPGERLMRIKEQLRAVPVRGIGYGVLRWLGPDAELRAALGAQPEPEISFNYLGQLDGGAAPATRLRFAAGPRGRESAEGEPRRTALAVSGGIVGGSLQLSWTYGKGAHRRETIERVAAAYADALRALIAHCRGADAGGCTPSDFPLAELTQAQLDLAVAGGRVDDLYPLSSLQEGLLFHALYGGESQAYQVQVAQRLEGPLDVPLLRRAWNEVVGRHPILRTSFAWDGLPRPLQRVEHAAEVPWTVEDWRGLTSEAQEAALERYLAEDRARGFALDRAPLLRSACFRVGDESHWIVSSRHHLLMDGWASSRVANEVMRQYAAWSTGQAAEPPRSRPYRDYIAWLRRREPGAAERHWRGVLAGFTAPTPLPGDRPALPGAEPRPARVSTTLSAERTQRLEDAARGHQVTLNTLLQGAWGLLLSRYAGEDDVVFGNTVSGRPAELEGVEEMIGVFINTLPVRMRVPGGARLGPWLDTLQRTQAAAREHEYAPLVQVQGWSEVPRGAPLFESLFVFESFPVEREGSGAGAGAALRLVEGRAVEWTTYPLVLVAGPGRQLQLIVGYDENRFDAATAARLLAQVGRMLEQMADRPDARLAQLEMTDADERRRVVEEWNRTERPYPRGVCIHERFDAQVRACPDAEALAWGDERWSYAELDARANQVAHGLRAMGVGPESRVGVLLERGPELVVALLAILKAGGCYVPLDPAYPPERLRMMLADAGARVVVTLRAMCTLVAENELQMFCLYESNVNQRNDLSTSPRGEARPENLSYIVYTSGSTGRPKGVMVGHREVVQLVCETDFVRLGPGDRVAQASNASFDALTFEVWGALLNGATLVGIPRDVLLSPPALRALLRAERITTLYQTTALLNQLSREQPDIFASLREVLFGGQAVDADSVRRLLKAGKPERLLHVYGPTETTAWCSYHDVRQVDDGARTVSVGVPIGNARIYVLDPHLYPTAAGVPGEAYVGGAGVVRGYLDRPGLTAERFVPDPFGVEPGARMYRTGDRMRWKADGTLEFISRLDEQVKIRGFRIEPGEVESVLTAHEWVEEARVIVREDAPGEPRLVAYVVGEVNTWELREHLGQRLPEYMLPAAFVIIDRLPLTPTGKLDAGALPVPELAAAHRYVAPRTPVEEILAEIWTEVLQVERVGVEDRFFELGGHSLLLIQVGSHVREIFGVELPLRVMFEASTIAALAGVLTTDPRYAAAAERAAALMQQVQEMSGGG